MMALPFATHCSQIEPEQILKHAKLIRTERLFWFMDNIDASDNTIRAWRMLDLCKVGTIETTCFFQEYVGWNEWEKFI